MSKSITSLPVGAFFEDRNGSITSYNTMYLKMLGLTDEDDKNISWRKYIVSEDLQPVNKEWDFVYKSAKPARFSCRLQKPNGNIIWVDIKVSPLSDDSGGVGEYACVIQDITNQKMFETVLERFKKAVEKTDSQIVFTDPAGSILYANDSVEKTTGFSSGEVVGTKAGKLWGGLMDKSFYTQMWDRISDKKLPFSAELINKKKNGETYYAEINITPVLDRSGNVEFFVGIERDITYIKEMDKVKNEFISLASHQLRTPLSSIKWLCELFWQENTDKLSHDQTEIVSKVQNENERLITLVNSLLNVSRIESDKLNVKPVETDLNILVSNAVDNYKTHLDKKEQTLELSLADDLPKQDLDPKLVGEALTNLISNANKYTPAGGRIWVKVKKDGDNSLVSVADNGIGIPVNDKRRIFEKFFRAANAGSGVTDGNGLGLYLVKWVAESHGGRAWFESEVGTGTTFYLSFPLKAKS